MNCPVCKSNKTVLIGQTTTSKDKNEQINAVVNVYHCNNCNNNFQKGETENE